MKNLNKIKGCLFGGAAGDALGYAVEFNGIGDIVMNYGENGIAEYQLINGVAEISDDTQMTLFTANGLLICDYYRAQSQERDYLRTIYDCYCDWLITQGYKNIKPKASWLNNISALNNPRAPGGTCLSALGSGKMGTASKPLNESKGCGGVMRVAPIGLYFDPMNTDISFIGKLAADTAAITHGHPLGYIPAYILAIIVSLVSHKNIKLFDALNTAKVSAENEYADLYHMKYMSELIEKAVFMANDPNQNDFLAIRELGQGWVGEEALAISIYCALKHENNFDAAIRASVNHSGDSDSTGALTGNILGAYLGYDSIPEKYKKHLECFEVINETAKDIYSGCPPLNSNEINDWHQKYSLLSYSI